MMTALNPLHVVIINTPNENRGRDLILALQRRKDVLLHLQEAFMVRNEYEMGQLDSRRFDRTRALAIIGRSMLPGEVGCAISHSQAQEFLCRNPLGGLIIEDDAIITNLDGLIKDSKTFLTNKIESQAVLSFYNNEFRPRYPYVSPQEYPWTTIFGSPSSTVAYAITKSAAVVLAASNQPVYQLADWPFSRVKFSISNKSMVSHPKNVSGSVIDRAQTRNRTRFCISLQVVTFIYFLKHHHFFASLRDYFERMVAPKIDFRLNRIKLIRRFSYSDQ